MVRSNKKSTKAVAGRSPNEVDRHVGRRIRVRRMELGMSQEALGDKLGLTFQQVQKYEKGTNRVGAGRIAQIAEAMEVGVAWFFDGGERKAGGGVVETAMDHFASEGLAMRVVKAFPKLAPKVKRSVVDLMEMVSGIDDAA